jgi:hypothetical protein
MSRRPATGSAISLFPFLAVLVCTMGALILLLIAMTKKIQQRALARERAAAMELAAVPPEPEHDPDPVYLPDVPSRPASGPTAEERAALAAMRQAEREEAARLRAAREAEIAAERERLRRAWAGRVAEAEAERDRLKQAVATSRAELKKLDAGANAAARDDKAARDLLAKLQRQQSDLAQREATLANADKELAGQLAAVKQRIDASKRKQASAPSPYALIPYDGVSGTVRHPIYIECTDIGLKFLPEGEIITAKDLEGFTEGYNPLLAGSVALMRYWNEKRVASNGDEPEPYVLLLVRPSGSVAYYIARKLLARLDVPFGYELIEEDWALATPSPDPEAAKIVRTAVTEVVNTRDNLMDALAGRGTGRGPTGPGGRGGLGGGSGGDEFPGERVPTVEISSSGAARPPSRPIPFGTGDGTGTDPGTAGPRGEGAPFSGTTSTGTPSSGQGLAGTNSQSPGTGGDGAAGPSSGRPLGTAGKPGATGPGSQEANGESLAAGPATLNGGRGSPIPGARAPGRIVTPPGQLPETLEPLPSSADDDWRGNVAPGREPGGPFEGLRGSVASNLRTEQGLRDRPGAREAADDNPSTGSTKASGTPLVAKNAGAGTDGLPDNDAPEDNTFSSKFGPTEEERSPTVSGPKATDASPSRTGSGSRGSSAPRPPAVGGASGGEPSAPGGAPAIGASRGGKGETGGDRMLKRWGYSHGRSTIGLEKRLEIHVLSNRILIGPNDASIPCGQGESKEEIVQDVLRAIEAAVFAWGKPPRNFYWIPVVKFVVYPGGNQHYERLQNGLREWGLFSTVEYTVREAPTKGSLSGALK